MWFRLLSIFILTFSFSCAKKPARRVVAPPTETARVMVKKDGKVLFNDRPVKIDELKQELTRLRQIRGAVWFVDEGSQSQDSGPVKKAIIAAGVPVRIR
jgi:biopolymer transport protein ExbD